MPHCCRWSKINMKSDTVGSSLLILSQATSHWELHLERQKSCFSHWTSWVVPCLRKMTSFRSFPFKSWQSPNKLWGYSPNDMQLGSLSEESWKWSFALVLQGSHPHPPNRPNRPRLCADWSGPQGHQPQTHPTSEGSAVKSHGVWFWEISESKARPLPQLDLMTRKNAQISHVILLAETSPKRSEKRFRLWSHTRHTRKFSWNLCLFYSVSTA